MKHIPYRCHEIYPTPWNFSLLNLPNQCPRLPRLKGGNAIIIAVYLYLARHSRAALVEVSGQNTRANPRAALDEGIARAKNPGKVAMALCACR